LLSGLHKPVSDVSGAQFRLIFELVCCRICHQLKTFTLPLMIACGLKKLGKLPQLLKSSVSCNYNDDFAVILAPIDAAVLCFAASKRHCATVFVNL